MAREIVADDAVIRSRISLQVYATRLIASARATVAAPRLASSIAFAGDGFTEKRVRALFESGRQRRSLSSRSRNICMTTAIPVLLTLAAAEPWRCVPGNVVTLNTSQCP